MLNEERGFLPSGAIQLEGLLSVQEALSIRGGVLLCDPHPLYGGDMDNPVIATAVDAAAQEGFSTLRFNFRGTGRSGGSYEEGTGEREDVKSVIDFLSSRLGDPEGPLILFGYSFGAWVGFPVAIPDRRIRGLIGIAPPLKIYDFGFLAECRKKKLLIAGDRDLYCPAELLKQLSHRLKEPKSLTVIPGADHFFFSHLYSLTDPLREFFRECRVQGF